MDKWIVSIRKMGEGEKKPKCDFCEASRSRFWVEEFAMALCDGCHATLEEECKKNKE